MFFHARKLLKVGGKFFHVWGNYNKPEQARGNNSHKLNDSSTLKSMQKVRFCKKSLIKIYSDQKIRKRYKNQVNIAQKKLFMFNGKCTFYFQLSFFCDFVRDKQTWIHQPVLTDRALEEGRGEQAFNAKLYWKYPYYDVLFRNWKDAFGVSLFLLKKVSFYLMQKLKQIICWISMIWVWR